MYIENNGYGWGIWLLIDDAELNSIISHPVHITIMCNMTKHDAMQLYRHLMEITNKDHIALCNNKCVSLDKSNYSENDLFNYSSGYYCEVEMWDIIKQYCKKRLKYDPTLGHFSEKPHITLCYSKDIQTTKYVNLKKIKYLKCTLVIADIRSHNPEFWTVLK
tara:strand:+ start:512 stop:997 length:486 start_codon:yes stop_codon:yes gene_type:complete